MASRIGNVQKGKRGWYDKRDPLYNLQYQPSPDDYKLRAPQIGDQIVKGRLCGPVLGAKYMGKQKFISQWFLLVNIGAGMTHWLRASKCQVVKPSPIKIITVTKSAPEKSESKKLTICAKCKKVVEIKDLATHDCAPVSCDNTPLRNADIRATASCVTEAIIAALDAMTAKDDQALKLAISSMKLDAQRLLAYTDKNSASKAIVKDMIERPPNLNNACIQPGLGLTVPEVQPC